jgi:hypothetical protein
VNMYGHTCVWEEASISSCPTPRESRGDIHVAQLPRGLPGRSGILLTLGVALWLLAILTPASLTPTQRTALLAGFVPSLSP